LIARTRQDGAGFGGQVQVRRNNEREAGSAGFSTTELPAAKAGAILQAANIMGKFQDTMAATMPQRFAVDQAQDLGRCRGNHHGERLRTQVRP